MELDRSNVARFSVCGPQARTAARNDSGLSNVNVGLPDDVTLFPRSNRPDVEVKR